MKEKPLNQEFFDEPEKFRFFQAVRLLERMFPERTPVGRDQLPSKEVVRFRSNASLGFPASEIQDLREADARRGGEGSAADEDEPLEMFVNFMGMIGALGVLPPAYTELAIERARYRDTAVWAFNDIFTHRAVSLFFRAWEKYRFPISYERGDDSFTQYLFDIIGLGTHGLRGELALPDESLLAYSGLISNKPRSIANLEQILSDYFGATVKVEQFFGQWLALDEESVTRLGIMNSRLGASTIVGTRVFDFQSKFRVSIGAVGFEQFKAFLPSGTAYAAIVSLVRFLVGEEFDFDLKLISKMREIPSCILTTRAKRRPQLGWSSWLKTQPFKTDDEQVILQTL